MRSKFYRSYTAVDFENSNQSLSGTGVTVMTPTRKIWDINSDYSMSTNTWVPPSPGLYLLDYKIQIISMANVTRIQIGIYEAGSLWLMLEDKNKLTGEGVISFSGAVMMDGISDDSFDLRIQLSTALLNPTASINGDDDYTAWGWSFIEGVNDGEVLEIE